MIRLAATVASLFRRHGCPWCPYRTHSLTRLAHHYWQTHSDAAYGVAHPPPQPHDVT